MIYSIEFLVFVLVLLIAYYLFPKRFQWVVLLIGSVTFYVSQSGWYLVFMVVTIGLTYSIAHKLTAMNVQMKEIPASEKEAKQLIIRKKKLLVFYVCLFCFGLLILFKLKPFTSAFSLVLPLGISYYSFQSVGYIVDVYRGKYPAEKNIFKYSLFVGYFPSMLQGPINRYDLLREQFEEEHTFKLSTIQSGASLFLWGLFKKLVVADRAGIYVSTVLKGNLEEYPGSILLMGIILFMVQMYGDFSGGIDMVEGVSEMFGIKMYENFRQPFFSRSIGEYWRRWHVSLGKWIKDYVFYPLCLSKPFMDMSRKIKKKNKHLGKTIPALIASIITFIIIGLWHEISMRYLCYGIWFGTIIGLEEMFEPLSKKLLSMMNVKTDVMSYRMLQRIRTWIIVLIGESFSILPSAAAFVVVVKAIFTNFKYYSVFFDMFEQGLTRLDFFVLFISGLIWWAVSFLQDKGHHIREDISAQNVWFRWILVAGIIAVIAIWGIYGPGFDAAAFLYAEV